MLLNAITWLVGSFEKTGSAKAIIGFSAVERADAERSVLRLATDGKFVIAYERTSQSTSLKGLPLGSFVTRSCNGRLVNAPLVTTERRVLPWRLSANVSMICW